MFTVVAIKKNNDKKMKLYSSFYGALSPPTGSELGMDVELHTEAF